MKAVNSRDRNFSKSLLDTMLKESDERLERYLKKLDEADGEDEDGLGDDGREKLKEKIEAIKQRRDRLASYRAAMEASGETQLSLTDPDARRMAAYTGVGVGYNVQIAVDGKHKLIVEQQVHNHVTDMGLLSETAAAAKEMLGIDRIDAVADKGYFRAEDIEACEAAGVIPYVPKPERGPARRDGHFPKEDFSYDATADTYTCPGGQTLKVRARRRVRDGAYVFDYINPRACKACALKAQCTDGRYRQISRYENEAILEEMAKRLAARPELRDRRRELVEHPFGSIKQWMGQGNFLMRRLDNVRAEFSLTALAYNIRRAMTLLGTQTMIAAVRA